MQCISGFHQEEKSSKNTSGISQLVAKGGEEKLSLAIGRLKDLKIDRFLFNNGFLQKVTIPSWWR